MLFLALLLPVLALLVQAGFYVYAKSMHLEKPSVGRLVIKSFKYSFIGVVISLLLTIAWMVWYEYSSGYSAGNGPIGWILFYGPVSVAIGQIMALSRWWKNAL